MQFLELLFRTRQLLLLSMVISDQR